jgi:hypothetical protein
MRERISTRQKIGIAAWSLLWIVSAAVLLRFYLGIGG